MVGRVNARIVTLLMLPVLLAGARYAVQAADPAGAAPDESLHAAGYDATGSLQRPPDLDRWVYLGSSLGMSYNDTPFSLEHPGDFQVVLMEPGAYEYFRQHGRYADGSMFLLSFYEAERGVSIDRAGFVPGPRRSFEIHVLDRKRYAEGHAFFLFEEPTRQSSALPPGSPCIKCHVPNGAFDGTFAQFYPPIRERLGKSTGGAAPKPSTPATR